MLSRVFREHFSLTKSDTDNHTANLNSTTQLVVMSRYFTLTLHSPSVPKPNGNALRDRIKEDKEHFTPPEIVHATSESCEVQPDAFNFSFLVCEVRLGYRIHASLLSPSTK